MLDSHRGPECAAAELRRVDQLRLAAVAVLPIGPLVVFGLRRRPVWALSPLVFLVGLAALIALVSS